jgi:hypothetical protein
VGPKLRSLLARVSLIGGVALTGTYLARHAPHDQTIAVRVGDRELERIDGVITCLGDDEPAAGFTRAFPGASPRIIRHTFSAPDGTYIVVITLKERRAGEPNPIPTETTFERRVSLVGGEVIVSPD